MPQPNITIQDSLSAQNASRLWFSRNEYFEFRLFGTTTDATPTELFVDGIQNNRIIIGSDICVTYFYIYAALNATDNNAAGGFGSGTVFRFGTGNITLVAGPSNTTYPNSSPPASVTPSANTTFQSLSFSVTGTASKTIHHELIVKLAAATLPESNFGRVS